MRNHSKARSPSLLVRAARLVVASVALVASVVALPAPAMAGKDASIVIDANTGKVLHSSNADATRHPASLTKMMTLYMLFEQMKTGRITKNTRIPMTRHAASMPPSKLGIKPGQSIRAEDAIYALVTKSANDVAAAVGEHIGGTEARFAQMMTSKARALGMKRTTFRNASGLPDDRQVTTARDMATLGMALREHFPKYYHYFGTRTWKFAGRNMANHNRLVGQVKGVDGIKTGYIRASGYNLVSSAGDGNRRVVAVVLGGKSGASRNARMKSLLASYLPKASGRASGPLIARAGKGADTTETAAVLSDIPVPVIAERKEVQVAAAYAATVPAKRPKMPVVAETAPVEEAVEQAVEAGTDAGVDTMTTASVSRDEWFIQIGAMPTMGEAIGLLTAAQGSAGSLLKNRTPFTEVYRKDGATYHRARFSGFVTKDQAWATCTALKKMDYACLAVAR